MVYEKKWMAGDGERGIRPWNGTGRIRECRAKVTHIPHEPQDDYIGDPVRGVDVKHEVNMGKNKVAHSEKHAQAKN